jgi:hypothetical protein
MAQGDHGRGRPYADWKSRNEVTRYVKGGHVSILEDRVDNPALTDDDRLLVDQATSATVTTTVTTFLAQPDVPRNIIITPGGTTADVPAGDIVVSGTNRYDEAITETFTLTANQTAVDVGIQAFKTVTSVVFPIQDGAAATYDVGTGSKIGLTRAYRTRSKVVASWLGNTEESASGTLVVDVDEVEKNTYTPNGTMDGALDLAVHIIEAE